jgi:HK97 gp10 family phage protein
MQGQAALKARFEAVPQKIRDALARELERQATLIVADMKRVVPVDTGRLREAIAWTWGDAPAGSISIGKVKSRQYAKMAITIYAGRRGNNLYDEGYYAHFQEFGTVKMAANPFFYPTWRANKSRARSAMSRAVKKAARGA